MGKFLTFMGETRQNEKSLKATMDVVTLLNQTNNTNMIKVDADGNVCLFGDNEVLLQIGCGKSTEGEHLSATLFYGVEEESRDSIDFDSYDEYIRQVYEMVNHIYNKKIKIVKYAVRRKCFGKKYYVLKNDEEWLEYESYEIGNTFFRIFFRKTYTKEEIYDFRIK